MIRSAVVSQFAGLTFALLAPGGLMRAQGISFPVNPSSKFLLCNSAQLAAATQLTFGQRACWYGSELASPWAALRAGFSSGIGQWKNDVSGNGRDADDYAHRFAVYYLKRSARETAELMAGYLNHEDPRPHLSGETTFGKRIHAALASVVLKPSSDGNRLAFAPLAGSFGSAFAGAPFYREHNSPGYCFRGAAVTYSGYFAKAVFREFRPDIAVFVNRMLRKVPK